MRRALVVLTAVVVAALTACGGGDEVPPSASKAARDLERSTQTAPSSAWSSEDERAAVETINLNIGEL